MSRPADVIHDLALPIFLKRLSHAGGDIIENFVPAHSFPFSFAPLSHPLQGIANPLGIGDLIERRWSFGTIASSAAGMFGVAFESPDAHRFLINQTDESARRLTIKTNSRDDLIMLLYLSRPMGRIVFDPIVPLFYGWIAG